MSMFEGKPMHRMRAQEGPFPVTRLSGGLVLEIFQLLDPATAGTSPQKLEHADATIVAVSVTATSPGDEDTVFRALVTTDGVSTDILADAGILPAGSIYAEFPVTPELPVTALVDRLSIQVTSVGANATGLIFEYLG